eukprot:m.163385 g.163385  ORF g.163385 m.163385 type:complete len:129 (-) comp53081_c0_seq3:252-638(-)
MPALPNSGRSRCCPRAKLKSRFLAVVRQHKTRIINISSISGLIGFPGCSGYCGSKFALEALTGALRQELAPLGVPVIAVNPGYIKGPLLGKTVDAYKLMCIRLWLGPKRESSRPAQCRKQTTPPSPLP